MTNSRAKGTGGEREWASFLRAAGFDARRGQQFSGGADSPDVICEDLRNFHFEVKRTEALRLYPAMAQAVQDADGGPTPVVVHRRNRKEWLVIMRAEDWLDLVKPANPYEDLSDIIYADGPHDIEEDVLS